MAAVLSVLGWSLAFLAFAVLAVLITPVWIGVRVKTAPRHVELLLRFFGGLTPLVSLPLTGGRKARGQNQRAAAPRRGRQLSLSARRTWRALAAAPQLIAGLLSAIHLVSLDIDADIGLPDPGDTGQLMGLLAPILYGRPPRSRCRLQIRPDFTAPRLEGDASLMVRFIPVAFAPPILRFVWNVWGPAR